MPLTQAEYDRAVTLHGTVFAEALLKISNLGADRVREQEAQQACEAADPELIRLQAELNEIPLDAVPEGATAATVFAQLADPVQQERQRRSWAYSARLWELRGDKAAAAHFRARAA